MKKKESQKKKKQSKKYIVYICIYRVITTQALAANYSKCCPSAFFIAIFAVAK